MGLFSLSALHTDSQLPDLQCRLIHSFFGTGMCVRKTFKKYSDTVAVHSFTHNPTLDNEAWSLVPDSESDFLSARWGVLDQLYDRTPPFPYSLTKPFWQSPLPPSFHGEPQSGVQTKGPMKAQEISGRGGSCGDDTPLPPPFQPNPDISPRRVEQSQNGDIVIVAS